GEGDMEGRDGDYFFVENGKDTERIVAPVVLTPRADSVQAAAGCFLKIAEEDGSVSIVRGRNGGYGGEFDDGRHDKAVSVVGVLADEVDAPGGQKEDRLNAEFFGVQFPDTAYILHSVSLRKK